MDRKLKTFFLMSFLILAHIPIVLCTTPAPIVYVAGDSSGDFICNGTNDQMEINQALQFVVDNPKYTTVYLKGPFTYIINDTILIGNCTVLTGDPSAIIKLADNANWMVNKPMIKENNSGSHDITIQGFAINGDREGNNNVISGQGYYNFIHLSNCQNINVHDMHLTDNHGDGLKISNCSNIKFYNNNAYLLGHDALYAIACSYLEAYNNKITCRTNSGLRIYNTNHVGFHDNTITSEGSGGAGIEIQKYGSPAMDDIDVYNNVIYETALAGIWMFGSASYPISSANVYIHHNQIYNTGAAPSTKIIGGILSDGFNALIENNAIDGAYGLGIVQNNVYSPGPAGSGYVVTVRNNIITNTRISVAGGNGYGINNQLTDTHSFVLQNNCFYNNTGGDLIGALASPSDIAADPQYADRIKHDYHLKSKAGRWDGSGWVNDSISSPCIDAGDPLSSYSNEPEPNGNRINIGPDGNTCYASKSELYVPKVYPTITWSNPANVVYGTPLSSTQLNAVASVPGSYVYTPAAGTVLNAGIQTLHVDFTPTDTVNYYTASKDVIINVLKASPTITWSNPASIVYGIALSNTQLNAVASVPGSYVYTPAAGAVLSVGTQTLHVDFIPDGAANYNMASKDVTIVVSQRLVPPVASFKSDVTMGYAPLSVAFTDTSTGTPNAWKWSFGDGTSSTTKNPVHTYSKAGKYTISLTASNTAGSNTVTKSSYIVVDALKAPVASFKSDVTMGYAPLSVAFTDTSTGMPASWVWNFGDGTSSTLQNPVHTYDKAGKYSVSLTVRNAAGSKAATKSGYISVTALKPPTAAFSASPTSGSAPLNIAFTDKSTGSPNSWTWNFGDGTSSTIQNAVHTYSKAGKYTVSLTVRNAAGSKTATKSSYIVVTTLKPPTATFSASTISGKAPLTVTFTDKSIGSSTSWSWNFGDKSTSTVKNPVYKYNKAGKYTVTLTVKNAAGSDTMKKTNYITVK